MNTFVKYGAILVVLIALVVLMLIFYGEARYDQVQKSAQKTDVKIDQLQATPKVKQAVAMVASQKVIPQRDVVKPGENGSQIHTSQNTDHARFITAPEGKSLYSGGGSNRINVAGFLETYGQLYGILDPNAQLELSASDIDEYGFQRFKYQQTHEGVPVFAGVLMVHFDGQGNLTSANGNIVPNINPSVKEKVTEEVAIKTALNVVDFLHSNPSPSVVLESELMIFRTNMTNDNLNGVR